ncbi:sulfite exporter TauE/SafE family protein [Nonlabens tegetincola]|uniref:sulfite exporter TauE/SafE family protein n=1 Tax=Nonlabens tegetincola TaxID=323273 RepID=UPI0030C88063
MIYTAFILGLLGSFHCVGMCGPIAFLLPLDRKSRTKRWGQLISYHSGRLFTYATIGMMLGYIGRGAHLFGFQQYISIGVGIIMIATVVLPSKFLQRFSITKPVYLLIGKVKSSLSQQLKKRGYENFFMMGFLNGFLPCGLVYMAVFASVAMNSVSASGIYMLMFGLGTIPMMTTAIYLGNFLTGQVKKRVIKMIPVVVVVIGALFVLRGLGLDIPYVSPSENVTVEQVSSQYKCH